MTSLDMEMRLQKYLPGVIAEVFLFFANGNMLLTHTETAVANTTWLKIISIAGDQFSAGHPSPVLQKARRIPMPA